jgi:hypothetical protein
MHMRHGMRCVQRRGKQQRWLLGCFGGGGSGGSGTVRHTERQIPILTPPYGGTKLGEPKGGPKETLVEGPPPGRAPISPHQVHQGAGGKGYRQALVVMCPPAGVLTPAPQVSRDAVGWCERYPLVSLRPDPNSNPDANPHLELERSKVSPPHRP